MEVGFLIWENVKGVEKKANVRTITNQEGKPIGTINTVTKLRKVQKNLSSKIQQGKQTDNGSYKVEANELPLPITKIVTFQLGLQFVKFGLGSV